MYYKSNLLFENKVIAYIYQFKATDACHSVSAKDKDLTVFMLLVVEV